MDQGILEHPEMGSDPAMQPGPQAGGGDQAVVDQVKSAYPEMLNILGNDKVLESIIADAKNPETDPGSVLAIVVAKVVELVKEKVPDLDYEVLGAFGMLAIAELADLFNQIGIEVTEEMKEEAASAAVQIYMEGVDDTAKADIQKRIVEPVAAEDAQAQGQMPPGQMPPQVQPPQGIM